MTSKTIAISVIAFALLAALAVAGAARSVSTASGPESAAKQAAMQYGVTDATYAGFRDLNQLTQAHEAVAQVRYAEVLGSYHLSLDTPLDNARPAVQPAQGSLGAWKQSHLQGAKSPSSGPQVPAVGPLKTDVLAVVVSSLKGNGLKPGDQIVITVDGGVDRSSGAQEGDPLPTPGQEEIVFLHPNTLDSSKFAVGAPDTRFSVKSDGTVAAVEPGAVGRAHRNDALARFAAAVRAAAASPTLGAR